MNSDYLLNSELSKDLYSFVKDLPIIDYHNHLDITQIKENTRFLDIYDLWIKVDPYKHRALRMLGVDEKYITGDASNYEKFEAWCTNFHLLIGNPLYVWSQIELEKVFNITLKINKENCRSIYEQANKFLQDNVVDVNYLLKLFNVEKICPCFNIFQDISYINPKDIFVPSLRGDDFVLPSKEFVLKLGEMFNTNITSLEEYLNCLKKRINAFKNAGCIFSDHALDNGFKYYLDDGNNTKRFNELLSSSLSKEDGEKLKSYILKEVLGIYSELNMVCQLHIGAQRKTSDRLKTLAGPAGGYAALGNSVDVLSLTNLFNDVEKTSSGLGKIVLFTLNPVDNEMLSTLSGSYSKDGVSGLITQGPAWWWSDHEYSIKNVFDSISSYSLLSNFIGMTTDSRSFLSLIRHDYFRRIICNYIADKINANSLPYCKEDVEELLKRVCYINAKQYF